MSVLAISSTNALSFSSFGAEQTTFGTGFSGGLVLDGDRFRELDHKQSYFDCTQHDYKRYDFDGRIISSPRSQQPFLSGEKSSWYVPLGMRRPSAPYRLNKVIVESFTNLLFGENRFPGIRVEGDSKTEDFLQTVARVGRLSLKMIQARNLGGAMGTVGLSWCYRNGKPRFDVHNAKHLYVHSWDDRDMLIPKHITEVQRLERVEWTGKAFDRVAYWHRRDWTPDWDIVFKPVLSEQGKAPFWEPDMHASVNHNDRLTHFTWVQNLPSESDDGQADCEGLFDSFDAVDLLFSVITRGATLNLDPTLKLKLDPDLVNRMGVKKGTDNALIVGKDGDASYMEMTGSSIDMGLRLLDAKRRAILEAAQCIVPNPNEVAAQGISSVAIKAMFAPMTSKCDVLREQYGAALTQTLEPMLVVAQQRSKARVIVTDADGKEEEGELVINLPPIVSKEAILDANGVPTGEDKVTRTKREPGEGGELDLRWPAYFPPTPDDQNKVATTLQIATGGKSFMSRQTATELTAASFNVGAGEEWGRVLAQAHADKQEQAAMFPGTGGDVDDKSALPFGAKPKGDAPDASAPTPEPATEDEPEDASDDDDEV